jgi:flagellar biosynthetic protein FliR
MRYDYAAVIDFYSKIDVFLAAFSRMAGFFVILPVFAGSNVPAVNRILFAVAVAVIAVTTGGVTVPPYGGSVFAFGGLLLTEFLIGFTVGFFVYIIMAAFMFMGQLVDFQIGFSMVSVFDPITQIQAPITGNLYYLVMLMLFIQTGTLHGFIYEIARSFETVPVGSPGILGGARVASYIVSAVSAMFVSAVRISLPVIGTILVVDVVLGILVKAVPHMNVFVVGMPIKVLVGLVLLYVMSPFFGEVYDLMVNEMMGYTINVMRGLAP